MEDDDQDEEQEEENEEEEEEEDDIPDVPEEFIFDARPSTSTRTSLSSRPRATNRAVDPVVRRTSSSPPIVVVTSSRSFRRVTLFDWRWTPRWCRSSVSASASERDPNPEKKKVYVEKGDMRAKKLARKAGALVVFLVDASGSMALNRMQGAKGAALSILESSYQSRDMVSIVPFRGDEAEVLLPPSRSIAMARNRLDTMACGGGSPLAHGLSRRAVGLNAMSTGDVGRVMIVCLTDGRANVSINKSQGDPEYIGPDAKKLTNEELEEEVAEMAGRIGAAGMSVLVIDTENKFLSSGTAEKLAQNAGGKYYYLPNGTEREIAAATASAMEDAKAP